MRSNCNSVYIFNPKAQTHLSFSMSRTEKWEGGWGQMASDADIPLGIQLADSGFFSSLPALVQREMIPRLRRRSYEAGQPLINQGEQPPGLFGILSGSIHTIGTAQAGQKSLLSIMRASDWTGFIGIVDGLPASFSIIAAEPVEAVFLPLADARAVFFSSAERMSLLAKPLVQILRVAYDFLIEVNGRSPQQVVAQRLLDLSRCIYLPKRAWAKSIEAVSQEDLAAASYLTRPTVNRILGKLGKQGLIKLGYGRIEVIAPEELIALSAGGANTRQPGKAKAMASNAGQFVAEMSAADVTADLAQGAWFASLPKEVQEAIVRLGVVKSYQARDLIYQRGTACDGIYGILSGHARPMGIAKDGQERLLSLIYPGDWAGFAALLDNEPNPISFMAGANCTALHLSANDALGIFSQSPELFAHFLAPTVTALRNSYEFLVETNGKPPQMLVARRLYDLGRTLAEPGSKPRNSVEGLNQSDVANATALSRPTVNKVLQDMAAEGLVSLGYGRITLLRPDLLRLRGYGEETDQ